MASTRTGPPGGRASTVVIGPDRSRAIVPSARFAIVVVAALVLAVATGACGDSSTPGTGEASSAGAGQTRTVTHDLGEVRIPAGPRRIACTNYEALEYLISLGFEDEIVACATTPVGETAPWGSEELNRAVPSSVATAGDKNAPDLEAIAASRPDLIVGFTCEGNMEETHDELSRIAPTLAVPCEEDDWPSTMDDFGRLLGRRDAAARAVADYELDVAAISRRHEEQIAGRTFAALTADAGELYLAGTEDEPSVLLRMLELEPHSAVPRKVEGATSYERLPQLDADYLIVLADTQEQRRAFEDNPLVGSLEVAREDRVLYGTGQWRQFGPVQYPTVLAELEDFLAREEVS